ncbi:MAG: DUF927 domain-containing protein, partial [Candidatus Obscuribacterales bacterium]|nr:DUF927 domain-containing protein [Candidatus Obscuribacterales bacterium]
AVTSRTSGINGEARSGLILEFLTLQPNVESFPLSRKQLHQDGKLLAQELAQHGFQIEPGKEFKLLAYLSACNPLVERKAVGRTGWVDEPGREQLVFVFTDGATDPTYLYQPERPNSICRVRSSGTLQDWCEQVLGPVRHNKYCLYEVMKSLSASLLRFSIFANEEIGGENLFGRSSSGKTTLLQLGASVWGQGATGTKGYIHKFNATLNGLEGLLCQHNDLPVYLDELGAFGGDLGTAIYSVYGGTSKTVMNQNRDLRPRNEWRTFITSSGEVSTVRCIEDAKQKKKAKAGQLVRHIDREITENTFANAREVDSLKVACAQYYGTLGRIFIDRLIAGYTYSSLSERVHELLEKAMQRLRKDQFDAIQQRAVKRFALAEVAGVLTVEFGLIPYLSKDMVREAIDTVLGDWAPSSKQLGDAERALNSLRDFYIAHHDTRFKSYEIRERIAINPEGQFCYNEGELAGRVSRELAGLVDLPRKRIYIFRQAIQEATDMETRFVARELEKRGFLIRESEKHLQHRVTIDGQQVRAYAISTNFLGEAEGDDEPRWEELL